jgi:hypothetical protein
MLAGDILCIKTTGELVIVLGKNEDGTVNVRRPSMGKDGIYHSQNSFFEFELQTSEEHLRQEANEMILKNRIQKETLKKMEDEEDKAKAANLLVN